MQTDKGPWYEGTAGERIAVRLSSTDTNGAYAIVESFAAPGCSPPMHLHRHEEEHFVVLAGTYPLQSVPALPFRGEPGIVGGTYPMRLVVF
jgi:quercetin dioxygenase-like cupin family protein